MNFIEGIIYMIWRGIAIGVIISAPMGPVGILCVQRTLEKGRRTGFFTGVGAAISDLFYCLLTGFGLSLIEDFLKANQNIIQIVGSVVLVIFGIYLFRSNPARSLKTPEASRSSGKRDVLQGFIFTVSNPLIIFLIIGLFARFNFLLPEINWIQYVIGYVSIIGGALMWWWVVTFFVNKVRRHFNLRSMWLINRVTGAIIMIFAFVGIFTAISSFANAATPHRTLYMNSERGFEPLSSDSVSLIRVPHGIVNDGNEPQIERLPLERSNVFTLAFRANDWKTPWGLELTDGDRSLEFRIKPSTDNRDELYTNSMMLTVWSDGKKIASADVGKTIEPGAWMSYRLKSDGTNITLAGGRTSYKPLLTVANPGLQPDSIGFVAMPGSSLSLDYVSLELPLVSLPMAERDLSHFADADVRETYFGRSTDRLEGVWQVFDYSFDESLLRTGGAYRLAIVKGVDGYDLVYLDGATKNASKWQPGTLKGRLLRSEFADVYEVEWLNPAAVALDGEIKAQFAEPDLLILQFVDYGSLLRMRKIKTK